MSRKAAKRWNEETNAIPGLCGEHELLPQSRHFVRRTAGAKRPAGRSLVGPAILGRKAIEFRRTAAIETMDIIILNEEAVQARNRRFCEAVLFRLTRL